MTQPSDAYELPEDLFGREAIAEKIKGLLESDIDLSPMVIDGDWGIGKTVFCRRLINKINESQQLNCVYIDAFRADHIDDPLISIISEIGKLVEKDGGEGKLDSFIDGAKPFIRTAAKTLGKAAVSFALKQSADDIAEGYDKEVENLAGASIDASIDLLIRDKINAEKNLDTLHRALEEVTKEKKLVILIDELDRCRASFAIDILETIKHVFTSKKVQIVIVANSSQLEAAFRHRYGSNDHTKNYFEKFYNYKLSLSLEKTKHTLREATVSHSYKLLFKSLNETPVHINLNGNNFKSGVENLIERNSISLREINMIKNYINLIFHFKSDNDFFSDDFESLTSILIIFLYMKDPSLSIKKIDKINRLLGQENFSIEKYETKKKDHILSLVLLLNYSDKNADYTSSEGVKKTNDIIDTFNYLRIDISSEKEKFFNKFNSIYKILNFS